jgi:hypothetical protein
MRFALEHQNPLVAIPVTGAAAALPADQFSLVTLLSADVLLWALKPAEEGIDQGVIARVWNVADAPRSFSLALPGNRIPWARRTTHIETDLGAAPLSGGVLFGQAARQQLLTYRLGVSGIPAPGAGKQVAITLAVHPNPALRSGESTLDYTLSTDAWTRVSVYDAGGSLVRRLHEGADAAGGHILTWDGLDTRGRRCRPGVYFARIEAGGAATSRRLVRL